ncbi:MAG: hypothetical protein WCA09_10985 [Burkholderiales bacterium]
MSDSEKKPDAVRKGYWGRQLSDVDKEIARLASICDVQILDPGVIQRVIGNDATVCGKSNQLAFDKLRTAILIHYAVMEKSFDRLGVDETRRIVDVIVAKLKERFGDHLGDPKLPR